MKKYSLVLTLIFAGCLNTQTKTNLKRPDFSVAPVMTESSPVTTKSGCCNKKVSFEKESEIPEEWLKPMDPSEPF